MDCIFFVFAFLLFRQLLLSIYTINIITRKLMIIIQYRKQKMKKKLDNEIDSDGQSYGEARQLLSLPDTNICDVWQHNFEEQMLRLMKLTQKYNIIAMDTEFPGMYVSRNEIPRSRNQQQLQYLLIKSNVEQTKLIQIGFTISDDQGNVPYPICTWQFNFKFDINKQKIVNKSYDLLKKAGVQFERLHSQGIDFMDFAQYFQGSGFVYNPQVKWIVFHGASDFAYLLRLVKDSQLPSTINEFYEELKKYFPQVYDLKYILRDSPSLKDYSLAKLSYQLNCNRIGPQHQAGSDSLLTLCCYFRMLEQSQTFNALSFSSSENVVFGIGKGYVKTLTSANGYQNSRQYQQSQQPTTAYIQQQPHEYYYDVRGGYMNMNQQINPQHLGYHYYPNTAINGTTNPQSSPLSYYLNQYQSHYVPNGSYVMYQGHGNGY